MAGPTYGISVAAGSNTSIRPSWQDVAIPNLPPCFSTLLSDLLPRQVDIPAHWPWPIRVRNSVLVPSSVGRKYRWVGVAMINVPLIYNRSDHPYHIESCICRNAYVPSGSQLCCKLVRESSTVMLQLFVLDRITAQRRLL